MELKYSEHPKMFKNHPLGFVLAVLLVPIAIGILILLWWFLMCKSTRLDVIGNDIVLTRGLLSKDTTEVDIARIRSVNVYQSFFNRMFGVGNIKIYTAGDEPEIEVSGVPNPNEFRLLVKQIQG